MRLGYKHSSSNYILLLISNWLWQPHVFTNHSHTCPLAQQPPGTPASDISMWPFGRITCCCPNTYTHPHRPLKVCVNSKLLSFPFFHLGTVRYRTLSHRKNFPAKLSHRFHVPFPPYYPKLYASIRIWFDQDLQKQTKKYQKYNYNWFERERNY